MFNLDWTVYIANIPALLIGFAFHEFAHAFVADRLGDPTPRSQGRLTLNPIAHLDLMGALMALLFQFGWAKPVQTNPRYYKMDPTKGHVLVALAGPVMNLLVAFIVFLLDGLFVVLIGNSSWMSTIDLILETTVTMNLALAVFNLLPIPPLDGYAVVAGLLPYRLAFRFRSIERYGWVIMMVILFTGVASFILGPLVNGIFAVYRTAVIAIISLFG